MLNVRWDFIGLSTEAKPTKSKYEKTDYNRTTLDSKFDVEPSKEYKDRVHAQAKGYTSVDAEKNKIEKTGETIVCLPHKMVVEIVGGEAEVDTVVG